MNKLLSLKVSRQGLADAYTLISVPLVVGSLMEVSGCFPDDSWRDTLTLGCILFWALDEEVYFRSPILSRVLWWSLTLGTIFVHTMFFLAAMS